MHYKDCIMFQMAKAYQRVHAEFKSGAAELGLTPIQCLVLQAVFEEPGLSSGEIGQRLHIDSATLSGILDRLIERGWIIKNTSAKDRRVLEIHPTEQALEQKTALDGMVESLNEKVLASFRVEEKMLLRRMLEDLAR
ncbi:MarR family winged helix-turn-helix transcriptional regulator [Desulfatibacillum aliphaticivorans]|uniref:Transcriptional regulator, MarR family n=1 Tax=Desulfatibacillum aliphaticivorans TaxID=218208 RepID=B8FAP8_DESAL|nr:MarR family transcriptional regulator [Desulfatibacillum aliphaticivorans]ACL03344.1 transcriptional regulator, MarR family [Desulfatibacillum aliphaticivorans]